LKTKPNIKDKWDPPPEKHLKMNFDGTSKGNMSLLDARRIIKDREGNIRHVFSIMLGKNMNNATYMEDMMKMIHIAKEVSIKNLIVEGESQNMI